MSLAKCNVCSRYDRNISVVCESRCLICSRCQGNPVIKTLFVDKAAAVSGATDGSASALPACPLCDAEMSRSMVSWCSQIDGANVPPSSSTMNVNIMGNSRATNDLDTQKNCIIVFLRKFTKAYGELGGVSDTYLVRPKSNQLGSRPSTQSIGSGGGEDLAFGADTMNSGAFATTASGRNSPSPGDSSQGGNNQSQSSPGTASGGVALVTPSQPLFIDPEKVLPPKFKYSVILETACDAFVLQWQSMLKNGNESMATMCVKACTRRKMSTRTNDYKLKGLLDFYNIGGPALDSHLMLVLFGRVAGIIPRSKSTGYPEMLRKAWGPIATSVLVIAHCDRCWKMGELRDGDDNPSAGEVKDKLRKLTNNRTMSLKRAIRLVIILMNSNQAHWGMTPFLAAVKEYNVRSPWHSDSVARLLHMLFQVSKPHGYEYPVQPANPARQSTPLAPATPKGFTANDVIRDMRIKSKTLWKANPRNRHHAVPTPQFTEPGTPLPTGHDLAAGHSLMEEPSMSVVGDGTFGELENSIIIDDADDENQSLGGASMASLASVTTGTSESTAGLGKGYKKMDPFLPTLSGAKAQAVANELLPPRMGVVDHNAFDICDYETAIEECGTRQITAAEVALVCVEAWECECALMQYNMNRALVAGDRRPAIAGAYNIETATGTKQERRTVLRILKWYASVFKREVYWDEVRELTKNKAFPFDVPGTLIEKSTAELHALAVQVASEWEFQQAKDYAEDVADRAGLKIDDYAARIVNAMGYTRMNGTTGGINRTRSGQGSPFQASKLMEDGDESTIEQSTLYLGEEYADSTDVSLTSDFEKVKQMTMNSANKLKSIARNTLGKGFTAPGVAASGGTLSIKEAEAWRKYRSPALAPLAYASDEPGRHPLNMVDVLDNDPKLLSKLRLLSNRPVGPSSPQSLVRTIDEDIRYMLEQHPTDDMSLASTLASLTRVSAVQAIEEDQDEDVQSQYIPSGSNTVAGLDEAEKEAAAEEIEKKKNVAMDSKRRGNAIAVKATGRVISRIEQKKQKQREKDYKKVATRVASYEEKKQKEETTALVESKPVSEDLTYIDGDVAAGEVTLESALAFEKTFKSIVYKDKPVEAGVMAFITGGYLRPHQLEGLDHLDFSNADMGPEGAKLLAACFHKRCNLTHLCLNGNNIGDNGNGSILAGIVSGGGHNSLTYLDLRRNQLTMVTDGLANMAGITSLTSLNLAWNCLTLDSERHRTIMVDALQPLKNLTYLNLSHNRLQDVGLKVFHEEIFDCLTSLTNLDLKSCFITPLSYSVFDSMVRHTNPNIPIKRLNIRNNICKDQDRLELIYQARHHNIHLGIDEPEELHQEKMKK